MSKYNDMDMDAESKILKTKESPEDMMEFLMKIGHKFDGYIIQKFILDNDIDKRTQISLQRKYAEGGQ